jgi:hypothetical protein
MLPNIGCNLFLNFKSATVTFVDSEHQMCWSNTNVASDCTGPQEQVCPYRPAHPQRLGAFAEPLQEAALDMGNALGMNLHPGENQAKAKTADANPVSCQW